MSFYKFSAYLIFMPSILLIIGVVLSFLKFKKSSSLSRFLTLYFGILLVMEILNISLGYILRLNNQVVLPIYSLLELIFFMYLYNRYMFGKKHILINILGLIGVIYIAGELLLDFIIHHISPKEFQPYAKVVDNFVIILLALTFLYEKMSSYTESRWDNFRLNIVFLVFFTLNTIIFLPFNFLVNEDSGIKFYFWAGNVILLLLFYSYLIFEIIKKPKLKT